MSSVVISGDTSGAITVSAPAVSGTNTATLPAATGELSMLGATGQTWQTVTRTSGTTYTNTTGKPIVFALNTNSTGTLTFTVNGFSLPNTTSAASNNPFFAIIPPAATYVATTTGTIQNVCELR